MAENAFEAYQVSAQNAAVAALEKSPDVLKNLIVTSEKYFSSTASISAVQQQYQAIGLDSPNSTLESAITATMDCIDTVLSTSAMFQYYVTLTVPKIADGGNFGVGIQLETLKVQSELSDKLAKHMEELAKYQSSRADALKKCELPSISSTKSSTKSATEGASTGGEKGDTKTTNQSTATEEKTVETVATATALESATRKAAVVAVDLLFYCKAKIAFQHSLVGYMAICNFMEKNAEKIAKPRDENTSGRYSAMY